MDGKMQEMPRFDGLVLICDDNPMNREVIELHLNRMGLRSETAENGMLGVELVEKRIKKGIRPFDIIFMDIFMPVMDGVEAASKIAELGTGTPIVAMTAISATSEPEDFKNNTMPDYLSKPFTFQELLHILTKYLTPVADGCGTPRSSSHGGVSREPDSDDDLDDKLRNKLRLDFLSRNRDRYAEINAAIEAHDMALAHRLAHNMKSNAAMIGMMDLSVAAAELEAVFYNGTQPVPDHCMEKFKVKLELALEQLSLWSDSLAKPEAPIPKDKQQIMDLIIKLEPMLENLDPYSLDVAESLRAVPEAYKVLSHLEDYNFKAAAEALKEFKALIDKW